MVASSSRFAYSDCFDLMDRAIADPKGIRIKFAAHQEAMYFRIRLHTARRIDRQENMVIYNEGHPLYGKSAYDQLTMRVRKTSDGAWLRLERTDTREFQVESLAEPVEEPELELFQSVMIQSSVKKEPKPHEVQQIRPTFKRRL